MYQEMSLTDFSPHTHRTMAEAFPTVPILTLGERSYLVNGTAHFYTDSAHILVGKYSSLGHWVDFYIGMNHDYRHLTTYPMRTVLADNAAPHETMPDESNHHQIVIGSDVWIGGDVMIMSGVHIGSGAVIGAGTVVAKDVPPYAVAVGNPMRIIKYRFDGESIARLLRIKWWNWPQEKIEEYIPLYERDIEGFLDRFDCPKEIDDPDEIVSYTQGLRAEGYEVSYFIPDFEIDPSYAVWTRTIDSFLAAYMAQDRAALVLAMPDAAGVDTYAEAIAARLAEVGEQAPLILTHPCSRTLPFSIAALQASSAYITTREPICSYAVDYAADAGLAIRYGLDQGALLFPPVD